MEGGLHTADNIIPERIRRNTCHDEDTRRGIASTEPIIDWRPTDLPRRGTRADEEDEGLTYK